MQGPGSRASAVAMMITAAAAFVAGVLTMTPDPVGVFLDDAIYLHTARALAEGDGFVYRFLPGAPPAVHFPPGWPVLLSLVWSAVPDFPANVAWLKLVNPVLLAAAAALATHWAHRTLGEHPRDAALLVLLGIVTIPTLVLANVLLSEPLFLVLALLLAIAVDRPPGWRGAVVAGVAAASVMLVRSAGAVFVIATLMVWLLDRRWRDASVFAFIVVLLVAPWQWFVARGAAAVPAELAGMYGSYGGFLAAGDLPVLEVLRHNVADAWRMIGIIVSPLVRGMARHAIVAVVLAAGVAGLVTMWRARQGRVMAFAMAWYVGLVLIWPFQVDRFLWGVWPVLVLMVAAGLRWAWRAAGNAPVRRFALGAVAVVLVTGHVTYSVRALSRGWALAASRQMADRTVPLLQYVAADPRLEGRVLATEAAPMIALYTGYTVVPLERLTPREHLVPKTLPEYIADVEAIDRAFQPGAYIVLAGGAPAAALLAAQLAPRRLLREISPPGGVVRSFLVETR